MLKLRTHAWMVAGLLLLLVGLLGARAYSVATSHHQMIRGLIRYELESKAELVRLEGLAFSWDQAKKKFQITKDNHYNELANHLEEQLERVRASFLHNLSLAYPHTELPEIDFRSSSSLPGLKKKLEEIRSSRLQSAHDESLGLIRVIMTALLVTVALALWLLILIFRGLLKPLEHMKSATQKIAEGEFGHRLKTPEVEATTVTEIKDLAASFNRMASKIENLDRAKIEFLETLSHEIKNPLAALKEGMSLLVNRSSDLQPSARERALAACLIATKRLEAMINNLLDLSSKRLTQGNLYQFEMTPRDLNPSIETAIDSVRILAEKKRMSIQFEKRSDLLGAFNSEGMVRVFENLLINAVKYGQESTSIHVVAAPATRFAENPLPHLEITVSNQGPTIPETELSKIFDRFYRGSTSSGQVGLGIGLHVVKRIVDAHHGHVIAQCSEGTTSIRVRIPGRYETEAAV